jgi:hypothetical protein
LRIERQLADFVAASWVPNQIPERSLATGAQPIKNFNPVMPR